MTNCWRCSNDVPFFASGCNWNRGRTPFLEQIWQRKPNGEHILATSIDSANSLHSFNNFCPPNWKFDIVVCGTRYSFTAIFDCFLWDPNNKQKNGICIQLLPITGSIYLFVNYLSVLLNTIFFLTITHFWLGVEPFTCNGTTYIFG